MKTISDRQFEALARKSAPVGCLAERHPELLFGCVLKVNGVYCAVLMGKIVELEKGTKIKLWGGAIAEV